MIGTGSGSPTTLSGSLTLGQQAGARVITVASSLADEGKTTTVLSLARIMALAGERTIAVDCDLRRAGLTRATGLTAQRGLVEVLHGEASLESVILKDRVPNLDILPLAAALFSPEDLFASDAMVTVLARLRERYDHIILDTPPLLGVTDARTLAVMSDMVALVVKWNATPRNAVRMVLEMLHRDKSNVVGAILSMADRNTEAYGALSKSGTYAHYYLEKP